MNVQNDITLRSWFAITMSTPAKSPVQVLHFEAYFDVPVR